MWNAIKRLFGWAEQEFEDIVHLFQKAHDELDALVSRKIELADRKTAEAAKATVAAELARINADRARAAQAKFADLLGTPAT